MERKVYKSRDFIRLHSRAKLGSRITKGHEVTLGLLPFTKEYVEYVPCKTPHAEKLAAEHPAEGRSQSQPSQRQDICTRPQIEYQCV